MIYDNIVVGSGISALGCLLGLIKSNKKILCIDGSENNSESKKNDSDNELVFTKQNIPNKNYQFKENKTNNLNPIEVLKHYSFGGLSNVWGASCLRFLEEDFHDWPISYDELKEYYSLCEKIMNVSHFDDDISKYYNISKDQIDNKKLSLYSDFIKEFLQKKNKSSQFTIGYSRVGLDPKCYKCANCFFGCKDNYIFNTKDYINKLINNKQIEYKENLVLSRFIKRDKIIELEFQNQNIKPIFTKKLFIGAGSIQTPRIVINSLNKKIDLNLKESQVFFIPCIYTRKTFKRNLESHTLSQAQFFFKNNIKNKLGKIHYQIKYDVKLTRAILSKQFGLLSKLIPNALIERIFLITGFVNSEHSTFSAKIKKEKLDIEVFENKSNKKKIKKEVISQIKVLEKMYKFLSIKPYLKLGDFGISYHLGSSIPMLKKAENIKTKNNCIYTKKNGEISEFNNVFLIDSTNFTNIPSGSISLTLMANALRIGKENSSG